MPGKHAAPPAGSLGLVKDLHRRTLGTVDLRAQLVGVGALVVAITVFVVGAVAIGRAPAARPPLAVDPVAADAAPSSAATGASEPAAPVPSSEAAAPDRRPEPDPVPAPSRTAVAPRPRPTAPRTPQSAPAGALVARYVVSGSWDTGFVAGVVVFNPTGETQPWRVEISHAAADQVTVVTHWNADITRSGSFVVFAGGPVPPGGTQTFGFEATKKATGRVHPSGCTVNGTPCEIPG